jgi:hypothetical protein
MRYIGMISALSSQPPAPSDIAAFGDGIGYGADIISVSPSQIEFEGQLSIGADGTPSRRRGTIRVTGAEGLTTTFRLTGTSGSSVTRLVRFADPAGDTWTDHNTNVVSGSDRVLGFATPHPAGTFYVSRHIPYMWQRWLAKQSEWIANPLTSPTDSALDPDAAGEEAYVIGVAAGGATDHTGKRTLPEVRVKAFKIGTGPLRMQLNGGIHANETSSSYGFEGYVEWLLGSSSEAIAARAAATWYCYPVINFWGHVAHTDRSTGEAFTGGAILDANRIWDDAVPSVGTPVMRTIYMAAWAIDKGPIGFSASCDFHDRGWQGTAYDIRRRGNTFSGRTSREVAVQNAILALAPSGTVTSLAAEGDDRLPSMMGRQFLGTEFAALSTEGNSGTTTIAGWRSFGAAIGRGIMQRVAAGDFDANIPAPPPPPDEWEVTGGNATATVASFPAKPTSPDWAVTAGDATATITSHPGMT